MERFRKITIIGVGLIGGSLGLAIKKKGLADRVVGFFRNPKNIDAALRLGCVDEGTGDLKKAVAHSDLVILCSSVDDICDKLAVLKRHVDSRTIITDTGSTKETILKAAKGLNFIGAHPLTGSEKSGFLSGNADLFNKAVCILVPPKNYDKKTLSRVSGFWQSLGSRAILMTAQKHDAILGFTSHLPHAAAFALIQSVPKEFLSYAAGGLKDTTRIALSRPDIWCPIFLSNKKHLLKALSRYERSLQKCRQALRRSNKQKLLLWLKHAQQRRSDISKTC